MIILYGKDDKIICGIDRYKLSDCIKKDKYMISILCWVCGTNQYIRNSSLGSHQKGREQLMSSFYDALKCEFSCQSTVHSYLELNAKDVIIGVC